MPSSGDWEGDDFLFSPGFSTTDYPLPTYYDQTNASIFPMLENITDNITEMILTPNQRITYIIVPLLCVLLCTIATIINARILLCVKWIRRPLSPTIYISLSLAMADTCSAILIGLSFIFNSLLPRGFDIRITNNCVILVLEALRLSGILISTIHLLVLAANHYFGILCPFRSMTLLTPSNLKIVVICIWLIPTAYIFAYFGSFEDQAFQRRDCLMEDSKNFLMFSRFRTIFSGIFFVLMILMFAIYIHISIIVRRHQANRTWLSRHSRRHENLSLTGSRNEQQRQFERNLKAIWTTLLILSTYVICFMPAVIHFYLVCRDCHYTFESFGRNTRIFASSITNILLITKYLLNPLIYASRMQEIKAAIKLMNAEWRRKLCTFGNVDELEMGTLSSHVERSQRFSLFSSSSRRQATALHTIQVKNGVDRSPKVMTTDL